MTPARTATHDRAVAVVSDALAAREPHAWVLVPLGRNAPEPFVLPARRVTSKTLSVVVGGKRTPRAWWRAYSGRYELLTTAGRRAA